MTATIQPANRQPGKLKWPRHITANARHSAGGALTLRIPKQMLMKC